MASRNPRSDHSSGLSGREDTPGEVPPTPFEEEGRRTIRFSSSNIGLGTPLAHEDHRDFTVKASRRPAPASPISVPNSPSAPALLVRSNTTPTVRGSRSTSNSPTTDIRRSSSSLSSIYAPIPSPQYTIRTQPIGLQRSSSISGVHGESMEPTISGGLARRLSISSSEDDDLSERGRELQRPLKHRSESLPVFPPPEVVELRKAEKAFHPLVDLPKNPREWRPSQLALYLGDALHLHPRLQTDITAFVRSARISGAIFLRLQPSDMEELGINILWRPILNDARERLRKETLGGKMWGFEGGRGGTGEGWHEEPMTLAYDTDEEKKDEWKRSWRTMDGKRTSGRVRDMAQAFEFPASPARDPGSASKGYNLRSPQKHGRSDSIDSTTSTASIDSGSSDSAAVNSPFDFDVGTPESTSSPELGRSSPGSSYQSHINEHDVNPYGLVRSSSSGKSTTVRGAVSRVSVRELADWKLPTQSPPSELKDGAAMDPTAGRTSSSTKVGLADLFGLQVEGMASDSSQSMQRRIEEEEGTDHADDLMSLEVRGGKKGSMILVKRSQLEGLHQRLDEVELKLAEVLSASRSQSPFDTHANLPPNFGSWILQSFSAISGEPAPIDPIQGPSSWTALGGYMVAASIGIGIVAGEVVISKLFGFHHRR